jgi:hypothetical protein
MTILVFFSSILIGCFSTGDSIFNEELIYRGSYKTAGNDSVGFNIFRLRNIIHRNDSSRFEVSSGPSPFSPTTSFHFYVANMQDSVRFEIGRDSASYDLVYSGIMKYGDYELAPDVNKWALGKYFLRQTIGQESNIKRFILLK